MFLSPRLLVALPLLLSLAPSLPTLAADFPAPSDLKSSTDLPDPLTMLDGTKIATKADWEAKRKPELKALFQHYMYGRLPPPPDRKAFEIHGPRDCLDGKAELRDVTIYLHKERAERPLAVILITPKGVKSPPVFVGMNFCGNHALLGDPQIPLPTGWVRNNCGGAANERATDAGRGSQKDTWNADLIVSRGYALATFYSGDIDPDTPDMSDGIGPLFYKPGQLKQADDDASTIALWAWGFHRVVDFLTENPQLVDPERIAVVGHSRNGKTALLAGAMDDRIALIIPHQAGCGGTAPSRTDDPKAESVKRINTSFPHWFCDNFKKFNDDTSKLPFDQHCLLALCAPRPVLYSNAQEDQWANPNGQFEMLRAADPVYQLYGVEGLAKDAQPEIGTLVKSPLGYFLREGKHSMSREDWQVFLDYADAHLKTEQVMSTRFRVREVLAVVVIIALAAAVVLPAILAAREAGRRLACQNNLKQLSLGVLNYSDTFGAFPMGTYGSRDLRPVDRFSWYLPLWNFIEGKPPRLLLDATQAWNAEVNQWPKLEYTVDWNEPTERKEIRPLHTRRLFGCPTAKHRETVLGISVTEYVGLAGLGSKSPEVDLGHAGCGAWGFDRQIKNTDVIDGLGSTISLIETNRDPGPWLAGGPPTVRGIKAGENPYIGRGMQFGGLHPGGCQTAMLDGSVRFIENEIDCKAFSAMVTIAGQD